MIRKGKRSRTRGNAQWPCVALRGPAKPGCKTTAWREAQAGVGPLLEEQPLGNLNQSQRWECNLQVSETPGGVGAAPRHSRQHIDQLLVYVQDSCWCRRQPCSISCRWFWPAF